jgi:hypothetical protein
MELRSRARSRTGSTGFSPLTRIRSRWSKSDLYRGDVMETEFQSPDEDSLALEHRQHRQPHRQHRRFSPLTRIRSRWRPFGDMAKRTMQQCFSPLTRIRSRWSRTGSARSRTGSTGRFQSPDEDSLALEDEQQAGFGGIVVLVSVP